MDYSDLIAPFVLLIVGIVVTLVMPGMRIQRKLVLIASFLGMFATFLPWYLKYGWWPGTLDDGWFTLVLFGAVSLSALLGNRREALACVPASVAASLGASAGIFGFWRVGFSVYTDLSTPSHIFAENPVPLFGLYLVTVAGLAIPLIVYLFRDRA